MTSKSKLLLTAAAIVAFSGSAAMAADLYVPPAAPVAAAPAATNWDGPYIGASVGYGWGTASTNVSSTSLSANTSGWLVGAQLGYNYQIGQFVLGAEADIDFADMKKTAVSAGAILGVPYSVTTSASLEYLGTVRARAGFAVDRALIYPTGGLAYGNVKGDAAVVSGPNFWTASGSWRISSLMFLMTRVMPSSSN